MQKYTKESNGYTLEISIDEKELSSIFDKKIKELEEVKSEYNKTKEFNNDWHWEYHMHEVNGDPECDFCTFDEIIEDLNSFKETVEKIIADNGETLWPMIPLKKNGTFKKSTKPVIKQAINGSYWDESYGWNTLVLRITPIDDTHAKVDWDTIVIHW